MIGTWAESDSRVLRPNHQATLPVEKHFGELSRRSAGVSEMLTFSVL